MFDLLLSASIIDWIKLPFGYLLRGSYALTQSYAVAILIFAIVIRLILFPLGIKQQKGMIAQARLRPKEMKIRNKYKGLTDRESQEKLNTEIMELYKEEKYSPFSGCLPLLIQLPIILILFYMVTAPISYVVPAVKDSAVRFTPIRSDEEYNAVDEYMREQLNYDSLEKDMAYVIDSEGNVSDANGKKIPFKGNFNAEKANSIRKGAIDNAIKKWYAEYDENGKLKSNAGAYAEINFVQKIKADTDEGKAEILAVIPQTELLLEFDCSLFGLDLLGKPEFFNWLLLIPILSGILSFISAKITKKLNSVAAPTQNGTDAAASMKIMDLMMPLFSVYIAFIVPGAVGFYWMMSNVIQVGQSFILAKLYPIPTQEQVEAEYAAQKKSKKNKNKKSVSEEPIETTAKEIPSVSKGKLKDK